MSYKAINTLVLHRRFASRMSVGLTALLQCLAFLSSCADRSYGLPGDMVILSTKSQVPGAIDIFFFDSEEPSLLDSYQQVTSMPGQPVFALSGPGGKHVAALEAVAGDLYSRSYVRAYPDLSSEIFSLEQDNPVSPLLWGEMFLEDGRSREAVLEMKPALCAVRIRSVCCNFRGRPYGGVPFENDKLYLLNAVSGFAPFGAAGPRPVSWENLGFPTSTNPLLGLDGLGIIGSERQYPEASLYCYPNPYSQDVPGKPVTRLVLEGNVGEVHCYYPINIPEMESGDVYELDITLTRIGTSDPDLPAGPDVVHVEHSAAEWYETEGRTEYY